MGIWVALAIAPFLLVPRNLQNYYGAAASVPLVLFLAAALRRHAARWALVALLA